MTELKQKKDLVRWAKRRAEEHQLPFSITVDDFEIPDKCPVLSIPLYKGDGKSCRNSPTLDRIVPQLGYVPGNVIVISNRANQLKSNATFVEIQMLCDFYEDFIIDKWMQHWREDNDTSTN